MVKPPAPRHAAFVGALGRHMAEVVNEPEQRSWLSHALAGLAVASAGLATITVLSTLPTQTLAASSSDLQTFQVTGAVPSAFVARQQVVSLSRDPAVVVSDDSRQQVRIQGLERSYLLATGLRSGASREVDRQQSERETALASAHAGARDAAAQAATTAEQRGIEEQVAGEMAARAGEFRAEAEAELDRQEAAAAAREAAQQASDQDPDGQVAQPAEQQTPGVDATRPAVADANGALLADTSGLGEVKRAVAPLRTMVTSGCFGASGPLWHTRHSGLDLQAAIGTPVYAVADGVVSVAGDDRDGWAGHHVVIEHGGDLQSVYAHLSVPEVRIGQRVKAGQLIGLSGDSGHVSGPHLHFELNPAGTEPGDPDHAIDPLPWLENLGVQVQNTRGCV